MAHVLGEKNLYKMANSFCLKIKLVARILVGKRARVEEVSAHIYVTNFYSEQK